MLARVGFGGITLQYDEGIIKKPIVSIIINGEIWSCLIKIRKMMESAIVFSSVH